MQLVVDQANGILAAAFAKFFAKTAVTVGLSDRTEGDIAGVRVPVVVTPFRRCGALIVVTVLV